MFIYPIYNHNWRNISTIYIYIYMRRLVSNEIFSPSNKIHPEVGRSKDLSAPRYVFHMILKMSIVSLYSIHRLVFPTDAHCVLCEKQSEPLCKMQINFNLPRVNNKQKHQWQFSYSLHSLISILFILRDIFILKLFFKFNPYPRTLRLSFSL